MKWKKSVRCNIFNNFPKHFFHSFIHSLTHSLTQSFIHLFLSDSQTASEAVSSLFSLLWVVYSTRQHCLQLMLLLLMWRTSPTNQQTIYNSWLLLLRLLPVLKTTEWKRERGAERTKYSMYWLLFLQLYNTCNNNAHKYSADQHLHHRRYFLYVFFLLFFLVCLWYVLHSTTVTNNREQQPQTK